MNPTPEDIDAVLSEISRDGTADETGELWWVTAIDPDSVEQSIGVGKTRAEAVAAAWINNFFDPEDYDALRGDAASRRVPRYVPEGWTFAVDNMPEQGRG